MALTFEISTLLSFDAAGKRKADVVIEGESPEKKRGPGRPKNLKPKKRIVHRKAPTMLRRDRPVETQIPMDIWENILAWATLDKLLRLREICVTFYSTLQREIVWKTARLRQFGPDHPSPPDGLTEMQYADLLVGIGCHGAGCPAKETRRTYWAFRRRWCEACLVKNLVRGRQVRDEMQLSPRIARCLPQARYDSWGHYQWAGCEEENAPNLPQTAVQSVAYSRWDIAAVNKRFAEFEKASSPSEEEITKWWDEQAVANRRFVQQLHIVETWVEQDRKVREKVRATLREQRVAFFRGKAASMDPPLAADALELCDAYVRSIRISKAPSKKAWQKLEPKLMEERAKAEHQTQRNRRAESLREYRWHLHEHGGLYLERRRHARSPEQRLALDLADRAILQVIASPEGCHPMDFTPLVMRQIYSMYDAIPNEEKPQTSIGPYRLILDDARLIYTQRLLPAISRQFHTNHQSMARKLRCPGRSCYESTRHWEFEDLIKHYYADHASALGYDATPDLFMLDVRHVYPWLRLEWPRSLPILAINQPSVEGWDLDAVRDYVPTDAAPVATDGMTADAFQYREPSLEPGLGHSFTETVLRAVTILRGTNLRKSIIAKIALEFARRRNAALSQRKVHVEDLHDMMQGLEIDGLHEIFDGHRCFYCDWNQAYNTWSLEKHSLKKLVSHWFTTHWFEGGSWDQTLIALPDGYQVYEHLNGEPTGKAWTAFRRLFVAARPVPKPQHSILAPRMVHHH